MVPTAAYPESAAARDRWILALRGPRNSLDPRRPYTFLHEKERGPDGTPVPTSVLFLTNRECPFRCLYCDLWRNTLEGRVPAGAIPAQIEYALDRLPSSRAIKLYNAGSFFDPAAIPPDDYPAISELLEPFERVIVECHPAFVGERCLRFADLIPGRLEVAMGLETANPNTLARLNKRMTLESFRRAADLLLENGVDLRTFIIVRPPFQTESEGLEWACRSLDLGFDCGASVCSLIPARAGNGALERLQETGDFAPPRLRSLESAHEYGLRLARGRVFADEWDIERLYSCACSSARAARMAEMNRTQRIPAPIACSDCAPRYAEEQRLAASNVTTHSPGCPCLSI